MLQHVTLTLPASQTHVLLGASGCGRDPLLRLIAGTTAPDSGTVVIDGTPVVVTDPCPLAAQVGYMTQRGGLFPHLTAEQNVTLMARVRNMPKLEQQWRLDELSTLVGLSGEHLSDIHPSSAVAVSGSGWR